MLGFRLSLINSLKRLTVLFPQLSRVSAIFTRFSTLSFLCRVISSCSSLAYKTDLSMTYQHTDDCLISVRKFGLFNFENEAGVFLKFCSK